MDGFSRLDSVSTRDISAVRTYIENPQLWVYKLDLLAFLQISFIHFFLQNQEIIVTVIIDCNRTSLILQFAL